MWYLLIRQANYLPLGDTTMIVTHSTEQIKARRVYIKTSDDVEYELLETKEGLQIVRTDTGSVYISPNSANSVTIVPKK